MVVDTGLCCRATAFRHRSSTRTKARTLDSPLSPTTRKVLFYHAIVAEVSLTRLLIQGYPNRSIGKSRPDALSFVHLHVQQYLAKLKTGQHRAVLARLPIVQCSLGARGERGTQRQEAHGGIECRGVEEQLGGCAQAHRLDAEHDLVV